MMPNDFLNKHLVKKGTFLIQSSETNPGILSDIAFENFYLLIKVKNHYQSFVSIKVNIVVFIEQIKDSIICIEHKFFHHYKIVLIIIKVKNNSLFSLLTHLSKN